MTSFRPSILTLLPAFIARPHRPSALLHPKRPVRQLSKRATRQQLPAGAPRREFAWQTRYGVAPDTRQVREEYPAAECAGMSHEIKVSTDASDSGRVSGAGETTSPCHRPGSGLPKAYASHWSLPSAERTHHHSSPSLLKRSKSWPRKHPGRSTRSWIRITDPATPYIQQSTKYHKRLSMKARSSLARPKAKCDMPANVIQTQYPSPIVRSGAKMTT